MLQGCGVYFNTFFNAEKAYHKALDMREERLALNPEDTVNVTVAERALLHRTVTKTAKVLELWPNDPKYAPKAVFLLAESQLLLEEYASAALKYEEYIRYFPTAENVPLARVRLAKALYLDEKNLAARDALREVLETNPQGEVRREALLLAARMRIDEESGTEALALYEQLLEEDAFPGTEARNEAHWQAAELAFELENWEKARFHALAMEEGVLPARVRFRNHRLAVRAQLRLERNREVLTEIAVLWKQREFRPFRADMKLLEARATEGLGDWPAARALYLEAVKYKPRSAPAAEAWYRVGAHALDVDNREDSARVYFDSARTAGRNFEYGAKGDALALALARVAELREPDTTGADSARPHYRDFMIAEIYHFRLPKPDSARVHLNRIVADTLEDTTHTPRAFYALAWIEENEFQDEARADSLYRVLLNRWPETEWAKQAEQNLGLPSTVQTPADRAHVLFLEAERRRFAGENVNTRVMPGYRAVVQAYPNTEDAAKARFVLAFLTKEEAMAQSGPASQATVDSVREAYQAVADDYPQTRYAEQAQIWVQAIETANGDDGGGTGNGEEEDGGSPRSSGDSENLDDGTVTSGSSGEVIDPKGEQDLY